MLAQNFLSPEALGLTEEQHAALVKTLGFFERGQVPAGGFHMKQRWRDEYPSVCGTAVCLCGWADGFSPNGNFGDRWPLSLSRLFLPWMNGGPPSAEFCTDPAKGARALRNFLETGEANWHAVMAVAA